MKYTEEQIKALKENPLMQMLSSAFNIPIEDIFADDDTLPKPAKEDEPNDEDVCVTSPLDIDEFKGLIREIANFNNAIDELDKIGIDITESNLLGSAVTLIHDLLSYLYDDDVANYIISRSYDKDPDEVAYDIIDFMNQDE